MTIPRLVEFVKSPPGDDNSRIKELFVFADRFDGLSRTNTPVGFICIETPEPGVYVLLLSNLTSSIVCE